MGGGSVPPGPHGDNLRAGAEYRTKICQALVRRGLLKLEEAR